MRSTLEILRFCNDYVKKLQRSEKEHCWSCINTLQDVIAFIYSGDNFPTEDDERNYIDDWEDFEFKDRMMQERADQQLNFIKSNQ